MNVKRALCIVVAAGMLALLACRGSGPAAAPPSNMAGARAGHTTTLISDDKVLVAGGVSPDLIALASAEVRDLSTGTWSATTGMAEPRAGHTATLLDDGRVLVTGGVNNDTGRLATAEFYDPSTGTWSGAAGMAQAKAGHEATLLTDGRVLVFSEEAPPELYDPSANSWSPAGTGGLSDEDMVNFERSNLLDSSAPTPSIETLLHAFLPHKFVDHTHSTGVLSLTNQPNGEDLCREVFGDRAGIVPYIKPGFDLARRAAAVFDEDLDVEALILLKHGIFTFAASAEQAYERMIEMVTLVEDRLKAGRRPVFVRASLPETVLPAAEVAPVIRGACTLSDGTGFDGNRRFVLEFRTSPTILSYVNGKELRRYSQAGVATPDYTMRTKNWPLILPPPIHGGLAEFKKAAKAAVEEFGKTYHAYFQRHDAHQKQPKTELDPLPRVVLVPSLGLFGMGRNAKDARIVADIVESTIETVTDAEAIGTFESASEADLFDIEYWSLEQAKLGKSLDKPFAGCVAVVTGGGGAIGAATAEAFAREGAEVAVLDIDETMAQETCRRIGGTALAVRCDVTEGSSVRAAFDTVCERFGGVDLVVSNAGAAWQGKIADVPNDVLRESFDLNFFAHQTVAQNAVRVMRAQGIDGTLLFNVSKQAINPGKDFGPYGLPKAATLFLVRQYALDHGGEGIRANAVNADRVRGGLLTPELIASRAKARGVTEEEYLRGNLLGEEVTPKDVAEAFVHQALEVKTTADVTTVDGGNIAAILR